MYSYDYGSSAAGFGAAMGVGLLICWLVMMAISIFLIVAMWKMFVKADAPGWAAIVPFYNTYVLCEIVYNQGTKMFFFFIPFYNIYLTIKLYIDLAHAFGKETGFGIGLLFLPYIFIPILGFGKAEYEGYIE